MPSVGGQISQRGTKGGIDPVPALRDLVGTEIHLQVPVADSDNGIDATPRPSQNGTPQFRLEHQFAQVHRHTIYFVAQVQEEHIGPQRPQLFAGLHQPHDADVEVVDDVSYADADVGNPA